MVENIIRNKREGFIVKAKRESELLVFETDAVVLATGRIGTKWLDDILLKLGVVTKKNPVDLGLRIETPKTLFERMAPITNDPKYKITLGNQEIRTFCTCIGGKITLTKLENVSTVDGHFGKRLTDNANLAIVTRITPPSEERSLDFAIKYAERFNINGKPLIQTMADFLSNKPTTQESLAKSHLKPTLSYCTPGNIYNILSNTIKKDIIDGLTILAEYYPGLLGRDNLVYAPAIDRYWDRVVVDDSFQSNIENLYVIGDAAGYARGILQALWCGFIASRKILERKCLFTECSV
jgi:hypothetical protein